MSKSRRRRQIKPKVDDPYLWAILTVTLVFSGFWFWYRVPNFATPDEYSRLIRPMKVAGYTLADPGLDSVRQGFLDGRNLGASTYLYFIALIPLGTYVLLTGQLGAFASFGELQSRWDLWFAVPDWFWAASILIARLIVLLFAIGCVYIVYLLGRHFGDRMTGRLAALLLGLSLGFVSTAHEAGEDIPMLFIFLLSFLFVFRYLDEGNRQAIWIASALGGLAIAFKLTAGVIVFVIGAAIFIRIEAGDSSEQLLTHAGGGILVGIVTISIGMPSVLFGGPDQLITRVIGAGGQKVIAQRGDPIWLWIVEKYAEGMGIVLLVAVATGVTITFVRVPRILRERNYRLLLVVLALLIYLSVFLQWGYVRVHHLLPTFPLLYLIFANEVSNRFGGPGYDVPTIAVGFLIISTAVFAGIGTAHYASEPRDQATNWLDSNAPDDAKVEVYEHSIGDVGVPHHLTVNRYEFNEDTQSYEGDSLVTNESDFTEWMVSMPERQPEYIQLTGAEIGYLTSSKYPDRRDYIQDLMSGKYNYRIVAEFESGKEDQRGMRGIINDGINPVPNNLSDRIILLERYSVEDR